MSISAQLAQSINDVAVGRDKDIVRTVSGISTMPANGLTDAWLTVKARQSDADGAAIITKHITASAVTGTGQITDNGTTTGTAAMTFQLLAADTALLTAGWTYHFYIDVQTNDGRKDTEFRGSLTPIAP